MDSRFAVFFFIMGGMDTYFNECPTECLAQTPAPERFQIQYGDTYFQEDVIGNELYFSYDLPRYVGAIQPTIGASLTDTEDFWIGAGAKWRTECVTDWPVFIELSVMPGWYFQGDGEDVGFPLQFRGSLSAGYRLENGASIAVVFDHRSNANTSEYNPGIETLGIRLGYDLK